MKSSDIQTPQGAAPINSLKPDQKTTAHGMSYNAWPDCKRRVLANVSIKRSSKGMLVHTCHRNLIQGVLTIFRSALVKANHLKGYGV